LGDQTTRRPRETDDDLMGRIDWLIGTRMILDSDSPAVGLLLQREPVPSSLLR